MSENIRRAVTVASTTLAIGASLVAAAATTSCANANATTRFGVVSHCTYSQLQIREGRGLAATGHIGYRLHFRNTSSRVCSVRGYPGAAGLNKHGKQVTQARRTPSGFLGGLKPGHTPPTVVLKSGEVATAVIEGVDVNSHGGAGCPTLHGLLVTPPNDRKSVHLKFAPPDCARIQIHPVIRGESGSQTS
jgi:hypothetical protein